MDSHAAAIDARTLLHGAARRLRTADPVRAVGDVLDGSLSLPAGDEAYRRRRTLEPRFSEVSAGDLAFDLLPGGPHASPSDRVALATETVRRLTASSFGRNALRWVDGRMEVATGPGSRGARWGASLGTGFGRDGVVESSVHLEWGPELLDSLPASLHRVVQVVVEMLPGVRPAFSTVRTTPHGGSQQVTFEIPRALPLPRLEPVMQRLGLGHRHAGLMSPIALLLGARFTLPPGAAMLTVRTGAAGVELRLDVNLDAIPDPPPGLTRLIGLTLAERPQSTRAFRRWVAALTPDGWSGPGRLSVLSVIVRPDLPARLALNLCPSVIEHPRRDDVHRGGAHHDPHGDGAHHDAWSAPRDSAPADRMPASMP
jgi:hypothetical protein